MTWVTLENPKVQKATALRLSLSTKRGNGRMRLTVPTVLCGRLGLDKPDYVQIKLVAPDATGFKVGRLKHAVVIAFPVPPSEELKTAMKGGPKPRLVEGTDKDGNWSAEI